MNLKRIGFYGGTFNPPTKAHIEMAKKTLEELKLDKIIFMPVGDLYKKADLESGEHRVNMLKIACKSEEKFEVSDFEVKSKINYKANEIFKIISEKYAEDKIFFIMGVDNLIKLPFWVNAEELIKKYNYAILGRNDINTCEIIENNLLLNRYKENFNIVNNEKYIDCSSTNIRKKIRENKKSKYIDDEVYEYIKKHDLYVG